MKTYKAPRAVIVTAILSLAVNLSSASAQMLPDPQKDPAGFRRALLQRAAASQELFRQLEMLQRLRENNFNLIPSFRTTNSTYPRRPADNYGVQNYSFPTPSSSPARSLPSKPVPDKEKKSEAKCTFDGKVLTPGQYEGLRLAVNTQFIEKSQWEAADAQLLQAISYFPELYIAHANRAYVLRKSGRMDDALVEAEKAHQLAPTKVEPLFILASIEQTSGDLDAAIEHYRAALASSPNHPLADVTRALIERLTIESAKQNAIEKTLEANVEHEDYFEYVTYDSITKWPTERFPLKVYIPPETKCVRVPGYKTAFGNALRESLEEWHKAANDAVNFVIVPTKQAADIECQWTDNPLALTNPAEAGETRSTFDLKKGMLHAKILLLTTAPGIPNVAVKDMKRTALHELGHSLGLMGHSPEPDDIMFCSVSDMQMSLTERDAKTLQHLYRPTIQLADHYHETGLSENSIALNEDGMQLLCSSNLEQASLKFAAALKINPNCEPAKRNLATCLNRLAMNDTNQAHIPAAITQLTVALALDVQGEDDDKRERVAMMQNLATAYNKAGKTTEADQCRMDADTLAKSNSDDLDASPTTKTDNIATAREDVASKDESKLAAASTATPTATVAVAASAAAALSAPAASAPAEGAQTVTVHESEVSPGKSQNAKLAAALPPRESQSYLLFNTGFSAAKSSFQLGVEKQDSSDEDIDFGPYMADLQRRIKRAWFPPKGNESKRVVVIFKIHSHGELSNLRIDKSSGVPIADTAGLKAVQNAAPFRPLPEGAPDDIDVQFTFDYNVFGGAGQFSSTGGNSSTGSSTIERWKALILQAPTAENLSGLGWAYEQAGHPDEAKREYLKALLADPKNAFVQQRLFQLSKPTPKAIPHKS